MRNCWRLSFLVYTKATVIPLRRFPEAIAQISNGDSIITTENIPLATSSGGTSVEDEIFEGCLVDMDGVCSVQFDSSMMNAGSLSIGLGSPFLTQAGRLVLVPESSVGKLIVNPSDDVADFCSGPVGYLEGISGDYSLIVGQLGIGSHSMTRFRNLALSLDINQEFTRLPRDWVDNLIRTIGEIMGIEPVWSEPESMYTIPECSGAHVAEQLPDLTISIRGVMTDDPINLVLYSEDYFDPVDCSITLQPNTVTRITLGRSLLDNVVTIFDGDEHQLGFCDPV